MTLPIPALDPVALAIGATALLGALTTYPYLASTISYRQRDNGLAFIVLLMGVGIWNAMLVAQLLTADPLVAGFFLSLGMVGAVIAGVGWFLFAATASSTPAVPHAGSVYGLVGVFVGLDISLAVTNPVHELYWMPAEAGTAASFAAFAPGIGYWLNALVLVALFGAGAVLFRLAHAAGNNRTYSGWYTVVAATTMVAILASAVFLPGGWTVAPIAAVGLTTIGWVQARRGRVFESLRAYRRWLTPTG